jgi:hypothetical protein
MIHKRFNHTRHLVWAAFFLTVFVSSAVTHQPKENNIDQQLTLTKKPVIVEAVLVNTIAIK